MLWIKYLGRRDSWLSVLERFCPWLPHSFFTVIWLRRTYICIMCVVTLMDKAFKIPGFLSMVTQKTCLGIPYYLLGIGFGLLGAILESGLTSGLGSNLVNEEE